MLNRYQKIVSTSRQAIRLAVPACSSFTPTLRLFSMQEPNRREPNTDTPNEYKSQFENMFKKTQKVSKEEIDKLNQQQQQQEQAKAESTHYDEKKERYEEYKKAEFYDLLSGKKTVKERFAEYDDKNLQDIFKEFYSKAKEAKPSASGLMNSAKSSIGSLGSRLEQRRAKFREKASFDMDKDFTETPKTNEKPEEQKVEFDATSKMEGAPTAE